MRVRNGDVRRSALVAIVALVVAGARPSAQFEKTISSTFDGWTHLADGSYELVFGYMNRNADEIEVPLGPANQMDPRQRPGTAHQLHSWTAARGIPRPRACRFQRQARLDVDLRRRHANRDGFNRSELLARCG